MEKELIDVKYNEHTVEGFTMEEIEDLFDYVCTNQTVSFQTQCNSHLTNSHFLC